MSVEVMEEEWLYSEEQVRALLEWVRGREGVERSVYPFMRVVAEQALRPGEARGLRVSDVVLPERGLGKLTVRYRGKAREVPLRSQSAEFLRAWISAAGLGEGDLLFPACADVHSRLPYASRYGSKLKRPFCQGTSGTRGAWGSPSPFSGSPAL